MLPNVAIISRPAGPGSSPHVDPRGLFESVMPMRSLPSYSIVVQRGGSWDIHPREARSASRGGSPASRTYGFRIAQAHPRQE